MANGTHKATIVARWYLSMALCVPVQWTNQQVEQFATEVDGRTGWRVRPDESPIWSDGVRPYPCPTNPGYIHLIVDL